MALSIVRFNDIDLRTLGLSTSAGFEVHQISGRGLPPTRDRELQFPGDIGARDFGSRPDVRRLTISGILYANTTVDFKDALDKLNEITAITHRIDDMLFAEVEAQTLWFADESVIRRGVAQAGAPTAITLDSGASSTDDTYNQMEVEIIGGTGSGQIRRITDYAGSSKIAILQTQWVTSPDSTSTFWIRENRWHLVNYSGTMNEERITSQWFANGWSRITLPFKSVYPYVIGDWRVDEFTPSSSNEFQKLTTGNAPSFPVINIKGAVTDPEVVEVTHSMVAHFSDAIGKDIRNQSVTATRSANLFPIGGKLGQALAINSNRAVSQSDVVSSVVKSVLKGSSGIGDIINLNQGTITFWANKRTDWNDSTLRFVHYAQQSGVNRINIYQSAGNQLTLEFGDEKLAYDNSAWVAGVWYHVVFRWDMISTLDGTNHAELWAAADTDGSISQVAASSSIPTEATNIPSASYFGSNNGENGFNGKIDDITIYDIPLADADITSIHNSGTGSRADTIQSHSIIVYADFNGTVGTAFSNPLSQGRPTIAIDSISTTTLTVASGGDKVFFNGDRVVVFDDAATPNVVQTTINGSPSATSIVVTDSCAAVTGTNKWVSKNLIRDSGMELSGVTAWTEVGTTTTFAKEADSKKDVNSIRILADAAGEGFSQTITATSGEDYILRFFGKQDVGTYDVDITNGGGVVFNGLSDSSFTFQETCFEVTGNPVVQFLSNANLDDFNIDDVKVLSNLADDGGIEGSNTAGLIDTWIGESGGSPTWTIETTTIQSGSQAQKAVTTNINLTFRQAVTFTSGRWYEIASSINSDNASTVLGVATGGSHGAITQSVTHSGGAGYERLSFIFKAGSETNIILGHSETNLGTATEYFDDISIVHRADLDATLTAMAAGSRFVPTRLTRGYHAGVNEQFVFPAPGHAGEFANRILFRPQFPSSINTANGDITIFRHAGDAVNFYELNFDPVTDRFRFVKVSEGNSFTATSRVTNFAADEEIEIGMYSDPTSGGQIAVNGSTSGSSHSTDTSSLATYPTTIYIGNRPAWDQPADAIIDEFEAMVKAHSTEYFAERYRKGGEIQNTNARLVYTGTLAVGDVLTVDASDRKVVNRVKLYDASAASDTDALTNSTILTSRLPIMAKGISMLWWPKAITNGIDVRYRKNWN